ncbi:MAG TPA: amidohydrolase family protein, partial [Bryobacteraceae bacterium]|nr:amidohydrolase family protein [Bryobacteraceae bacterium]
ADTPWGSLEIADAHVHFFSPAFFKSLAEQKNDEFVANLLGWEEPTSPEALAYRWAGELDRHNIARAMLIASVPNDTHSVGAAIRKYPERFSAVYMTNPLLPSPDIRLQAAFEEDEVSGIFLFPAMHHYSMHDPKVRTLIQVAGSHAGAIVYVHCGVLSLGFRKKLGLPSAFDMRYSNPIDLHEVAASFPRVNFVIPHFGAGYLREALMVADLCPNVYLDTSSSNSWTKYLPEGVDLEGAFRRALDVIGPKRLLFGSDSSFFPRGWVKGVFDAQTAALSKIGISAEAAGDIFGGNMRRLIEKR